MQSSTKQIEPKGRKLTDKQANFVLEYQRDFNATQAAIRAGFSPESAREIGYQLLEKTPHVREVLDRDTKERLQRLGDRADATIEELLRIGHFDIRKLFNSDGSLKPPNQWDDATAAAVAGLQVFEVSEGKGEAQTQIGLIKKLKMLDKVKALELLGKHQKLFGSEGNGGVKVAVIILEPGAVRKPANSGMSEEEE